MSGKGLNRSSDYVQMCGFYNKNVEKFEKRECNRFRSESIKNGTTQICQCGYSKDVHSTDALQNESIESQPSTKTFPTDAFGELNSVGDEEENSDQNNIRRYVRLDCETDVHTIMKLFSVWNMDNPNVIVSVVSDNDDVTDKGNRVTAVTSNVSAQNMRKKICKSIVEAVASTGACIITGGLNKGVDQLIGNEVNGRKRTSEDNNLRAVLGICNWGCLEDKKSLLTDSTDSNGYAFDNNPTGFSLNQHHTHFLLVDDGTQKKSGCECKLRHEVELSLTKLKTTEKEKDLRVPLIYILIGGGINSLRFVEHALKNRIPVLIATGTGGAADAISTELTLPDSATLENWPEISEKLFHRLEEVLVAKSLSAVEVRKVLFDLKSRTKLQMFLEIVQSLHTVKQIPSDNNSTSLANDEYDTVKRMRCDIGQMLVANGLQSDTVKQAVEDLEHIVLNETLENVKLVFNLLEDIRMHEQKDLLIKFKVTGGQKKSIVSFIADALNKEMNDPSNVYMRVAAWNDEKFFRKLLLDNWMSSDHPGVLKKLLEKGTKDMNKYVELVVAHNSNSKWMTKSESPLDKDFIQNKTCSRLWRKIKNDSEDKLASLRGKLLFIWCIEKVMPETAMLFWKRGQDWLAMALIAYSMSKRKKNALVDKEGYKEMKQQMQFFSQHAIDLLNVCYADNQQNTYDLLIGKVENLKESPLTPLQIAGKANFRRFISLVPIQDLLKKIWIKDIENYNKFKYVPMLLSEACPLLAPALFTIRLPTTDNSDETKQNDTGHRCKRVLDYFRRVQSFINTPFVKFTYGLTSYIGYLILFSVVMLTDFRRHLSPLEIFLNIWTLIMLIEEVKQAVVQKSEYLNIYNFIDVGAIITYIVGFILRVIYQNDPATCPTCLYVARIVLAFSLMVFFIRTLPFLSIYNDIGPKIYMMRRLITDLIGFMLILIVFISAYGVVSNIILYPNQPLNLNLLHDIFYDACWSVLQQFNREEPSGSLCGEGNDSVIHTRQYCKSTTDDNVDYVWCKANRCPANHWIVSVLLALYALFTVIMLLNVLIAMFNHTFTTINEREKGVSKMQRYRLIRDYSCYPMIPIPLCVITYPYFFIKYLLSLSRERTESQNQQQRDNRDQEQNVTTSKSFNSPPKAFEKILEKRVRDWESERVAKYYKETKDKNGRNRPIFRIN